MDQRRYLVNSWWLRILGVQTISKIISTLDAVNSSIENVTDSNFNTRNVLYFMMVINTNGCLSVRKFTMRTLNHHGDHYNSTTSPSGLPTRDTQHNKAWNHHRGRLRSCSQHPVLKRAIYPHRLLVCGGTRLNIPRLHSWQMCAIQCRKIKQWMSPAGPCTSDR